MASPGFAISLYLSTIFPSGVLLQPIKYLPVGCVGGVGGVTVSPSLTVTSPLVSK